MTLRAGRAGRSPGWRSCSSIPGPTSGCNDLFVYRTYADAVPRRPAALPRRGLRVPAARRPGDRAARARRHGRGRLQVGLRARSRSLLAPLLVLLCGRARRAHRRRPAPGDARRRRGAAPDRRDDPHPLRPRSRWSLTLRGAARARARSGRAWASRCSASAAATKLFPLAGRAARARLAARPRRAPRGRARASAVAGGRAGASPAVPALALSPAGFADSVRATTSTARCRSRASRRSRCSPSTALGAGEAISENSSAPTACGTRPRTPWSPSARRCCWPRWSRFTLAAPAAARAARGCCSPPWPRSPPSPPSARCSRRSSSSGRPARRPGVRLAAARAGRGGGRRDRS